jgi:hypothetical protein
MSSVRLFTDPFGSCHVATVVPKKWADGGVATTPVSVVIETADGQCVGNTSIYSTIHLEDLTHQELLDLLGQVLRNEVG